MMMLYKNFIYYLVGLYDESLALIGDRDECTNLIFILQVR